MVCRCSNVVTDKHKDIIWRPNYLVEMFMSTSSVASPIVYGEVKPADAASFSVKKDINTLAILSKRKLEALDNH
jgi:hypothetical protein